MVKNLDNSNVAIQTADTPVIYVLIGVPGSGKSTWSKKLMESSIREFVVVSSDAVIDEIAAEKGLTYSQAFGDYIGLATSKAKQRFREGLNADKDIIFDQTNVSKKKRRGILQQVPKHYRKVAVVFNTEDREVKNRLDKRAKETGKYIPESVMADMYHRWESPTRDEGFDEIIKA